MNTLHKCERCGTWFDSAANVGFSITRAYLYKANELNSIHYQICPECAKKFKLFMKGEDNLG
jgi:hypothetical protein